MKLLLVIVTVWNAIASMSLAFAWAEIREMRYRSHVHPIIRSEE